ncbi:hypothetical protein FB45DRAFT_937717 [Roridomyces roridus]|uniref:Secreted protein n=1 Tax=Roridomyces roridus TaxID=1738132 RepID=A0AAD7B8I4_9AGAR|nr:hypothetical protein FB45DRAFT_937717 [Roridomyces roridus]
MLGCTRLTGAVARLLASLTSLSLDPLLRSSETGTSFDGGRTRKLRAGPHTGSRHVNRIFKSNRRHSSQTQVRTVLHRI